MEEPQAKQQGERGRAPVRMQQHEASKKPPSYLGLSCAVSGYSPYTRYTSPDGRREKPKQIPVSSPPQTLDSVALVLQQQEEQHRQLHRKMRNGGGKDVTDRAYLNGATHTRKFETVSVSQTTTTTTKFYSGNSREVSPLSDASSSDASSGNGSGGTLVQRQIERLYGGRVRSVRTSTSPENNATTNGEESKKSSSPSPGGFFAKRFGFGKQRSDDRISPSTSASTSDASSPLDFKPLKVPAVFRLLRPEFRDQLKNSSCQIPGEQTSPAGRLSPARKSPSPAPERVIPIQVADDTTPKRPQSDVRASKNVPIQLEANGDSSVEAVKTTEETSPVHQVTSPSLVLKEADKLAASSSIPQEQEEAEIEDDDELVVYEEQLPEAVPEAHVLTTIIEEDNESTASGSQMNLAKSVMKESNGGNKASQPEVQDGHYFIKVSAHNTNRIDSGLVLSTLLRLGRVGFYVSFAFEGRIVARSKIFYFINQDLRSRIFAHAERVKERKNTTGL